MYLYICIYKEKFNYKDTISIVYKLLIGTSNIVN